MREENLAEVGVSIIRATRVDSEWVTHDYGQTGDEWISRYWKSEVRETRPIWELIVSGIGMIWGTELRKKAYEVIRAHFPASLGLLELSRVAFDMGFSLGQVVPFVTGMDEGKYLVSYIIDFRDATNPEFLDALRSYEGPKNTVDLGPHSNLVTPDLTPLAFEFSLPFGIRYSQVSERVPDHGSLADLSIPKS